MGMDYLPCREIQQRLYAVLDTSISEASFAEQFNLKSTSSWSLEETRLALAENTSWQQHIVACLYRPLDTRHCLYGSYLMDRPREESLRHTLLPNLNLARP